MSHVDYKKISMLDRLRKSAEGLVTKKCFRPEAQLLADAANLIELQRKQIHLLRMTMEKCKEKLEIYRDHSDGEYHGGTEHRMLMNRIADTMKVTK